MNYRIIVVTLICAIFSMSSIAIAIEIETVPVGNVGNASDSRDGNQDAPGVQNFGSVNYLYRIGTYEVTNDQYAAFLNAKAKSDPLELYLNTMGTLTGRGGIARSGSAGNFSYSVLPNMGNKPANNVDFYNAIRFVNWLNNGQGNADTETGAYTLLGGTHIPSNFTSITRNPGAIWFLPTENEWYKAAYHKNDGITNHYWSHPTSSDSIPGLATANSVGDISNPGPNIANAFSGADWNGLNGNVTTVGSAGILSASPYGTYDQAGNVFEWTETPVGINPMSYVARSGRFFDVAHQSQYSGHLIADARTVEGMGFRIATIPEPGTISLFILGGIGLLWRVRRKSKSC